MKAWARTSHACSDGSVPAGDVNLLKVPDALTDMQVILLSDILPTAWHANEMGQVGKGDTVAIWGAGPGQSTSLCVPHKSMNILQGDRVEQVLL